MACHWVLQNGYRYYGYWYYGADGQTYWYNCPVSNFGHVLLILFAVVSALVVAITVAVVIANQSKPQDKALAPPPTQVYSSIRLANFVPPHVLPKKPDSMPEVEQMTWEFGDFGDRHAVELYLALSPREYEIIGEWGLNEDPLEEEPLFDEAAIEKLLKAQQKEVDAARDDKEKTAGLRTEHREQLKIAKEQTWGRTIEYYLQRPYIREFETRGQARQYRDKLEKRILPEFRKKLEEYGNR